MEAKYLFVGLTLALTFGFVLTLNSSSAQDIMAHWSERRCDFDVLMTAFMYKPAEDTRSASDFATENFKFCIGSKSNNYLQTIFGVMFEALRKQFAASDIMNEVFGVLRTQLNSIYAPFAGLMGRFWVKFRQIGGLASRIFQHLYMSMKKAAATALASLFIALSLQAAFMNTIDLLIKVIMIVLYILMALVVVFFLPILPFLVIVLITVAGIEKSMPGSTGPMGSVFCFHKNTNVIMKNGIERISSIEPGDILEGGNIVQGVVEVPGEVLYSLDNILVSGYHSVHYEGKVIYVKDHPRSFITDKKEQTLWTLITSKREISVMGSNGPLKFLDWDEIPDTLEANKAWDFTVNEMLNGNNAINLSMLPTSPPCIDPSARVRTHQGGLIPISYIRIGTWIHDELGWTKVTGVCVRTVENTLLIDGTHITDGNWILSPSGSREWKHPTGIYIRKPLTGYQLITESGSFKIYLASNKELIVRDFTEVGSTQILESDFRVENLIKAMNKKDADKEEDEAVNVSRWNDPTSNCSTPGFS